MLRQGTLLCRVTHLIVIKPSNEASVIPVYACFLSPYNSSAVVGQYIRPVLPVRQQLKQHACLLLLLHAAVLTGS